MAMTAVASLGPQARAQVGSHPEGQLPEPACRRAGVALHPLRFRGQALGAGVGQPVVTAEPGVHDLFPVDLDEPALAQPVKDRVERPDMQPDLSVRDLSTSWTSP
jgi:hypothetical protein